MHLYRNWRCACEVTITLLRSFIDAKLKYMDNDRIYKMIDNIQTCISTLTI